MPRQDCEAGDSGGSLGGAGTRLRPPRAWCRGGAGPARHPTSRYEAADAVEAGGLTMSIGNSTAITHDARTAQISREGAARCEQILAEWMEALNRHDAARMEVCMRFPHVRLAANKVVVYDAPGSNPMDLFQRLMEHD